MSAIEPRRAPVRPRVRVHAGGVARLLEEEVAELLGRNERVLVRLHGAAGSGKSVALQHLAAVFAGDARVVVREGPPRADAAAVVAIGAMLAASHADTAPPRGVCVWSIAPWCDDDCLEYLRAVHRQRIAGAWAAWCAGNARHDLLRWPGLCTRVLDVLARDDAPADPLQALRVVLAEAKVADAEAVRRLALQHYLRELPPVHRDDWPVLQRDAEPLVRSRSARALLAATRLLELTSTPSSLAMHAMAWDHDLATAIAVILQQEPATRQRVHASLGTADHDHRLALALLALAQPGYRPEVVELRDLAHTPLAHADLHGLTISGDCRRVHLAFANLDGAVLDGCTLSGASLRGAHAAGASLRAVDASGLQAQCLHGDGVFAMRGRFARASFRGASLRSAWFACADLRAVDWADADLTGADLRGAILGPGDLRSTTLHGARLDGATLVNVTAAGVTWERLAAPHSAWGRADLTGASWPRADLRGASFGGCGLANVQWEDADLREADLRFSTFHLGNARSGLVGSDIACEGSRTGFYTDESFDDLLRDPEAVRKANLCGADLRGANLDGVDLYLVDLRGARLDPRARTHARRCRAILDDHAASA